MRIEAGETVAHGASHNLRVNRRPVTAAAEDEVGGERLRLSVSGSADFNPRAAGRRADASRKQADSAAFDFSADQTVVIKREPMPVSIPVRTKMAKEAALLLQGQGPPEGLR